MGKKEIKIRITEQFENKDIDKRQEILNKLLYKIIRNKEEISRNLNMN